MQPCTLLYLAIQPLRNLDNLSNNHTYRVDDRVLYHIIELTHRLKRICYLCDFILLIYTYALYNVYVNDLGYFAGCEVGMILLLGFIQNRVVAPRGNFIIKMVIEAEFTPGYIHLKTAAFRGPLWFKKESVDVQLPRQGLGIQEMDNPYPNIFKPDNALIKLTDGQREFYILQQYFSWRMRDELQQP